MNHRGRRCLTRAGARSAVAVCALLTGCATAAGGAGGSPDEGNPGARGRPGGALPLRREDRVVVTRFVDVSAVALSHRLVFIATPQGLGIYDRIFDGWLPPLTVDDGWPAGRITAFSADPVTDAAWIGTLGQVVYYQPAIDMLIRTNVPGVVDLIMFDKRDPASGAYVRASGQWSRISNTGFVTPLAGFGDLPPNVDRILPSDLAAVYREFPSLQSFERILTRDAQLRSWPVTAGARAPERPEVWLGTLGNGLFKVDPIFNQATHYPFGLLDRGVGALALAADGIWAAGLGTPDAGRGGLTFASESFQEWRWLEGPISVPLQGTRVNRMAVRGSRAWLATSRGLMLMNTRDETDLAHLTQLDGLPSDLVLSVVATDTAAWVGTARGLVLVTDVTGRARTRRLQVGPGVETGVPVRALLLTGDTLWIGSDAGLLFLPPDDSKGPVRAAAVAAEPRLNRPIVAIARSDSEVVLANTDDVVRFNLRTGLLLPRLGGGATNLALLGGITAMAMDAKTLWVGGPRGAVVVTRSNGVARSLSIPGDLPAEVTDIQLTRDWAWIATRNGLVRLRRLPDGTVQ